jgi:hypothetical protein
VAKIEIEEKNYSANTRGRYEDAKMLQDRHLTLVLQGFRTFTRVLAGSID